MIINNFSWEYELARQLEAIKLSINAHPLVLGGTPAYSGGIGGPTGGFIGYLPQTQVAGDYSEAEDNTLPASGATILDNLNRIRYRVKNLESGSNLIVKDNGTIVSSGVIILDFYGSGINIDSIPSGVTITISGGGSSNFLGLTDTPSSYAGQAGKAVVVNGIENAVEFVTISGLGGDYYLTNNIILYHNGEKTEYDATTTGLTTVLGNSVPNDMVLLPPNVIISGVFTLPAGVSLRGAIDRSSEVHGKISFSQNETGYSSKLANLYLYHGSSTESIKFACADNAQSYPEYIENCWINVDDSNSYCVDAQITWGAWTDYLFRDCIFEGDVGKVFNAGTNGDFLDPILINCKRYGDIGWSTDGSINGTDSGKMFPFRVNVDYQFARGIETNIIGTVSSDFRAHFVGMKNSTDVVVLDRDGEIQTIKGIVLGNISDHPGAGEAWFREQSSLPSYTTNYVKLVNVSGILYGIDENNNSYQLIPFSGGGTSSFLGLNDTPDSYTGHAGKAIIVNPGENAVEFAVISGLGGNSYYDPQNPPASSQSVDDEFNGSMSGDWAWSTSPNSTNLTTLSGWLLVNLTASNSHELRRTFSPGSSTAFGIETMLSYPGDDDGDKLGIALLDSGNVHIADFYVGKDEEGNTIFRSTKPDSPIFNIEGAEKIVNGSAESALGAEWVVNNVERSNYLPYSGSYALRGSNVAPVTTPYQNYAKQTVSLTQLGRYVLSCYLRRWEQEGNGGMYSRVKVKLVKPSSAVAYESAEISSVSWVLNSSVIDVDETGNWVFWFTPYSTTGGVGWDASRGACDLVKFYPQALRPAPFVNGHWLRIYRDASDIYTFYHSTDGITWVKLYTSNATSTTVAKLALYLAQEVTTSKTYGINYIRRYI